MAPSYVRALLLLLPAVTLLAYAALKCRGRLLGVPVLGGLAAGMGCAVLAALVEAGAMRLLRPLGLSPRLSAACNAFLVAALVEEGLKLLILAGMYGGLPGPRPAQRVLLAAVGVSMGFALVENFAYAYQAAAGTKAGVVLVRGSVSAPAHFLFSLAMGSLFVRATLRPEDRGIVLLSAFLCCWLMHGLFDLVAMSPPSTGLPRAMPVVLAAETVFALWQFNHILPVARAADGDLGEAWRRPCRLCMATVGLLGLAWPALLAVVAIRLPGAVAALPVLGIMPTAAAIDLLRSAARPDAPGRMALAGQGQAGPDRHPATPPPR